MDDTLYPEDRSRLEEIKSTDPAAVILNGYYCGHLGEDMSLVYVGLVGFPAVAEVRIG